MHMPTCSQRRAGEALDQLGSVFAANIEDFVAECLSEACDTVDYDGDRDDDFMCAALHELIGAAISELLERSGDRCRRGAAQTVLRLVAEDAGLVDALHKAEMGFVAATGERCGRIGAAAWEHPDVLARLMKRETELDQIGRALDEIHVALCRARPMRIDFADFARREVAALARESA